MACAKDGTLQDYQSTSRTARDYQERQERQADDTIGRCMQGKLTERQAKEALAKQFAADRRGFKNAIEKLEQQLLEKAQKEAPKTAPRGVSEEDFKGIPQRDRAPAKDKFGRYDEHTDYNPNVDADSIPGFRSSVHGGKDKAGQPHMGKVMTDENSAGGWHGGVQSVHYHRHSGGGTLSTFYNDGWTERYNMMTGEQQFSGYYQDKK